MATRKRVLVCGASGFIGRNLFETLSQRKDLDVYGTYLTNNDLNRQPAHQRLWRVNFTDLESARKITKGFDVVINAAAMTDGSGAVKAHPEIYIAISNRINTNIIEAVYENKVPQFIFMSCTMMYPSSSRPLKEEEAELTNIYAWVKVFAEQLCQFYSKIGQTKYTAIRHSNIYGPYDKFDLNRGHVFAATITKVMTGTNGSKIIMWGQGSEKRDFLHIFDLLRFTELVIDNADCEYDVFNVGLGKSFSVKELSDKIVSLSGKELSIEWDTSKSSTDTKILIDIKKAEKVLGWKPTIDIDEGIRQTIRWYLENHPKGGRDVR